MGNLVIAETSIGINKDGLYCLNHLHKAAVKQGKATDSQRPSNFVLSQAEFISAVENASQLALKQVKGRSGGTWAVEIIAMKYAGWIDPAYEVQLYRAIHALKNGDIDLAVEVSGSKAAKDALDGLNSRRALDDKYRAQTIDLQIKNAKALCEFLPHLGDSAKQSIAASLVNPVAGFDVVPLPRIEEKFYTTTEIAKELEIASAVLGRLANQNNLKAPEFGEFRLSQSQYSSKQVEQFYWNSAGRDALRDVVARVRA